MPKDDTLVDNFVTVTKRLPLKARFLVALCMVVVVFELISGVVELNSDNYSSMGLRNKHPHSLGKVRERKEINPELWDSIDSPRETMNRLDEKRFVHIHRNSLHKDRKGSGNNVKLKYEKKSRSVNTAINEMDDHVNHTLRNTTISSKTTETKPGNEVVV